MSVAGNYVKKFSEATHALPEGMHMSADYPFMLPAIKNLTEATVTLCEGGREEVCKIKTGPRGEYCEFSQKSAYEVMFNRKPTKFQFFPFKDERTEIPAK